MYRLIYDLEHISQIIGQYPEYVQGGGGNTSIKSDDGIMLIKASGYKLSDVTEKDAIAFIDYNKIREFVYTGEDVKEAVFNNVIDEAKIVLEGYSALRPSIEVGFHALLKKYVIHTHSVYTNIINCCTGQEKIVREIFKDNKVAIIGFQSPGVALTVELYKELERYQVQNNDYPEIIFLKNHGVVISSDDKERALELHEYVTLKIKEYFNLKEEYPKILIEKEDNKYISKSSFDKITSMETKDILNTIKTHILFPDQIVYFNLGDTIEQDNKFSIKNNRFCYQTNLNEALAIEETVVAYIYIYEQINKNNLIINKLLDEQVEYIANMESEKYRRKLIQQNK